MTCAMNNRSYIYHAVRCQHSTLTTYAITAREQRAVPFTYLLFVHTSPSAWSADCSSKSAWMNQHTRKMQEWPNIIDALGIRSPPCRPATIPIEAKLRKTLCGHGWWCSKQDLVKKTMLQAKSMTTDTSLGHPPRCNAKSPVPATAIVTQTWSSI